MHQMQLLIGVGFTNRHTYVHSLRVGLEFGESPQSNSSVSGIAYGSNYVVIRWPFLSVLVIQVFVAILFLAILIVETMTLKVDVVKGKLLPVLFAIDGEEKTKLFQDEKEDGKEIEDEVVRAMRAMAPRVLGGLKGDGSGGWKLQ